MILRFNIQYFTITFILFIIEVFIAVSLKEGFIRHTVGDYLASILLYCFIKSCSTIKPLLIVLITLFISYSLEWLQFINILETLNLDHYTFIKTLLGSSFSIGDLIAYTLGTATIYIIDYKTRKS